MRSCALWILACALLCAGGGASVPTALTVDVGETFPTSISTNMRDLDTFSCQLRTPWGDTIQFRPENKGDPVKYSLREFNLLNGCAVDIKVTDKNDKGIWELTFTPDSNEGGNSIQYNVTVNAPTETTEATTTTTEATTLPARRIENLSDEIFDTKLGETHIVTISYFDFVNTESCHLETPNGVVYNLNDLNIKEISKIINIEVACGIKFNTTEAMVGTWTLFSWDTRHSIPIERRRQFTINVEETVTASPDQVTITEGGTLYVRLAEATTLHETCKLVNPNANTDIGVRDENHREECGFVVSNVQKNYAGQWEIVYGNGIIYKAPVQVTVNGQVEEESISLEWVRDSSVDQVVGPANAVYCRISDPTERVVFEGFERCRISLPIVQDQHSGTWDMTVGVPGRVLTNKIKVTVTVRDATSRPRVITRVAKERPQVLLTCALEGQHTISTCKFREPSGRVLLATQGVGEDRYSFHGVGVSLESSVSTTECGLRITNPVSEDMGLWRCALETDAGEVYYGFLTVICPFAISLPNAPAIVTEPTLTASHSVIEGVEEEAVTMSCSVQSEIRYCYFRARNGTVFNVSPGTESGVFEYAGAGYDAGECGIRFRGLEARDTGAWSCHVGLPGRALEQRVSFSVNIQRQILANQEHVSRSLAVTGRVYNSRAVEYCRFVRIDGLGFTSDNVPQGYTDESSLTTGWCSIVVAHPTMLDLHPWTIAARIIGQDVEISDSTDHTIDMPEPAPEEPRPSPHRPQERQSSSMTWLLIVLLSLSLTLLALSLLTSRRRQWAYNKATGLRNSFRQNKTTPTTTSEPAPPYTQTA